MALKYVMVAVVAFLCVEALGAFKINKRSLQSSTGANASTEEEVTELCVGRTPCGWAVYNKISRYIDYFMKNKCECSKDKMCLREDDDISITAYVYRCKVEDSAKSTS